MAVHTVRDYYFASVDMGINRMGMKRMVEFNQRQGWHLKDEQ